MANIIKKPYEISLWDEILVFRVECFDENENSLGVIEKERTLANFEPIEGTASTEVVQYYKERKIAIIGSDTMSTPIRAVNSKLVSNVNGANTLTFSMYSRYWDEEAEEFFDNPFLKLLVNERKIKLRYGALGASDCKWYDLIVKNVQENSETKVFSYTAKDQFVNELSKSGFDLVLDPELENNMGNITTLAEVVLDGSDWKLGEGSSNLVQYKEEPLYEISLKEEIEVKNMLNQEEAITIPAGKTVYGFYGLINEKESHFQLLYVDGKYEVDDDHIITNSKVWFLENVAYKDEYPTFASSMTISDTYRGKRLVRQIQTKYDATTDKYVQVYEAGGITYYGYTETDYVSPTAVQNFITQPSEFTSFSGWERGGVLVDKETIYPQLDLQGFPDVRDINTEDIVNTNFQSFLKYKAHKQGQLLFNSGIGDQRSNIYGIAENDKFVFRIKYATAEENSEGRPVKIEYKDTMPNVKIGAYELEDGVYNIKDVYFNIDGNSENTIEEEYIQCIVKTTKAVTYEEMLDNRLGIFIEFPVGVSYYIEDVQFFRFIQYEKEILNEEGEGTGNYETLMAIPGGELIASARTKYFYYLPSEDYEDISQVTFVYEDYAPWEGVSAIYNDDQFEKIRSITAKESNRFNLIQTLCETFECWPKFEIEHNMNTGEILLDENDGYRQKKWVTFHEYIGKDNYAGFRYGINLKSIQRTLDSDGAVSKMVVKNNSNQFAQNGFCSVSRAKENPIGENFLLDFSYYVQQGLIGFEELNNDLYLDINGYLGYYKKLRQINKDREKIIEEQAGLVKDVANFEAQYQTYKVSVESAEEELRATEIEIKDLTDFGLADMVRISKDVENNFVNLTDLLPDEHDPEKRQQIFESANDWWDNDDFLAKVNKIAQLTALKEKHKKLMESAWDLWKGNEEKEIKGALPRFDEITEILEGMANSKRALNLLFYKKYSRFIQEGSWIKEDYIDDNLYYLDAENTLRNSAQPKVSYNIAVLELSQLQEYENYKFELGDKTYIEDTEFFGWVWKNGVQTPYHEEIVVSEITIVLDSPEQNTIKVQNYKTQFEDLFQRITATTQSVEYHTGEYGRAAAVVETDGTISSGTLQNSISNNAIKLENSRDQSVVWNETGITTTSFVKPNEIVRLVSGGLFLSNDGGTTWSTGITGSGINASYITTGQLNASMVNIMNGDFPSFRWDGNGLSAYQFLVNTQTLNPYGFNYAKFVRFDQYGIYGINGNEKFQANVPENGVYGEDKIWANAKYALTWKGFMLKNDDGSVRITSTDDIQVFNGEQERIKIGRIEDDVYGIRISNADGAPVMETDDEGELWLKNRLRIGTNDTSTVEIGYLDAVRAETDIHEVIHAGNGEQEFIVYEDGKMVAQGAEFHGAIYATGGKIGNLTIGNVEDAINNIDSITEATRKLDISSKLGYNFKVEGGISSPAALELKAAPIAFTTNYGGISWFGSNDFESWVKLADDIDTYTLTYENFKNKQLNSTYYIKAVATATDGTSYEDWTTIMSISDGEKGEDALALVITSTKGNYFKNNQGSTTLVAKLFKGGQEVDVYEPYEYVYIWRDANDSSWSSSGKTLTVTADEVNFSRTYICDVSKGGT